MPIRTILAYLPSPSTYAPVLDAAITLAGANNAHLIGAHVIATYPLYGELAIAVPDEVVEQMAAPAREDAKALHTIFQDRTGGNLTAEWRCTTAEYTQVPYELLRGARSVDLIVCGKPENGGLEDTLDIPERLIMESGRPVLMVPPTPAFSRIGDRVLVAWNNSREAARAVFDALEMLKGASAVRIVTLADSEAERLEALTSAQALAAALGRHGVAAAADAAELHGTSAGDYLLSRIVDEGCDLLVMGCYGHPRYREMIFGGVSRDILRKTSVATLLSH